MKKRIYTIGRDPQSDIWLQDNTDVASRNHAVLEVMGGGKYFLTDQSRNGTYVNGIKISTGAKVPVTRRDVISFAHVQELDWTLIPVDNSSMKIVISILSVVAVAVVALVVFKVSQNSKEQPATENIATLNLYTDDSEILGQGGGSINMPSQQEEYPTSPEEDFECGIDDGPVFDSTEVSTSEEGAPAEEVQPEAAKKPAPKQTKKAKESAKPVDAIY